MQRTLPRNKQANMMAADRSRHPRGCTNVYNEIKVNWAFRFGWHLLIIQETFEMTLSTKNLLTLPPLLERSSFQRVLIASLFCILYNFLKVCLTIVMQRRGMVKMIGMARDQELLEKRMIRIWQNIKFNHNVLLNIVTKRQSRVIRRQTKNIGHTSHFSKNNLTFLISGNKLWSYILHIQTFCTISMNRQNH